MFMLPVDDDIFSIDSQSMMKTPLIEVMVEGRSMMESASSDRSGKKALSARLTKHSVSSSLGISFAHVVFSASKDALSMHESSKYESLGGRDRASAKSKFEGEFVLQIFNVRGITCHCSFVNPEP